MTIRPYVSCIVEGVGGYVPKTVVSNNDLADKFKLDTSDEWITERTGIRQRHMCGEDDTTASMAVEASRIALNHADVEAQDIGLIIVATSTPDCAFPSTANQVQMALGNQQAVAFDLNAACSGFLVALITAQQFILSHPHCRHALVIGSEAMSRLVNWSDRNTAVLFGDGAGALVLSRSQDASRGIMQHYLRSDGQSGEAMQALHSASLCLRQPPGIAMNGRVVFRQAVTCLIQSTHQLLQDSHTQLQDIDWIIPHQANKRILDHIRKDLGVEEAKMLFYGDQHANTSAASIPLTWWKASSKGLIGRNQLVLLQAFGAGWTWGTCLIRT
jgi:3-oxoacyl-[acyl-carrier-protein] synthase-3